MRHLALALLAVTGCATTELRVTRSEIHHHLVELRRDGHALVDTTVGEKVELDFARVRELTLGCPDVPPFREDAHARAQPCALSQDPDRTFLVGVRRHVDGGAVTGAVVTTVAVGALAGLIACAAACDEPYSTISVITVGVSLGALLVGLFALWAPAMGAMH